jgi:hypothetical protein
MEGRTTRRRPYSRKVVGALWRRNAKRDRRPGGLIQPRPEDRRGESAPIPGGDSFQSRFASTEALRLTQNRFEGGAAPKSDVALAKTQLEDAKVLASDITVQRAQLGACSSDSYRKTSGGILPGSCHKYSEHSLGFKQPSALSNEHSVVV